MSGSKITLEEALKQEKIYVRNCTRPKGPINLSMILPSGRMESINIPKTYIPICITDQVPVSLLKESMDFRAYVTSGVLELVPPNEAEKILETKEAQAELTRIFASKYSEAGYKSKGISVSQQEGSVVVSEDETEENVSSKVIDILLRKMSPTHTLNELKTIEEELTDADLRYIVENASGKVKRWALKRIDKKSGTDERQE